jgi:predicted nucleic acid-binding protein
MALFARTDALGAFDAVLAASAARAGVDALVSADSAFADLAEIPHVIPAQARLSRLLKS